MKRSILGLVILTMVSCGAAQATVIFTTGNNPQTAEENILLTGGPTNTTTGTTVFGQTDISNTLVSFSSTTDILTEPSSGQARIEAQDGLINDITISLPGGGTFLDFILNPNCTPGVGSGDCGTAIITAIANEPGSGLQTFTTNLLLGNGENFLTLTVSGGETIASVTIDDNAPAGFQSLKQPRISGVAGGTAVAPIPEPSTILLLGSGFIGFAAYWRRKFFKK